MRIQWLVVGLCWVGGWVNAGAQDDLVFPPHERFAAGAAVRELARARVIPLDTRVAGMDRVAVAEGDRCVVLVTMRDDDALRQWLVDFEVGVLSEEEMAEVNELPTAGMTLHTSTGTTLDYGRAPVVVDVAVLGPLKVDERRVERAVARVDERRARFVANEEFLALGLDRAAATIVRLRSGEDGLVGFAMRGGEPFPAEEAAANRARLEARGLTAEDERAMAGAVPALLEFFRIASQTPGLRDILMKVVDIPWMALVRSLGAVNANIELHGPGLRPVEGLPGRYVVPLKVSINGAVAVVAELVVGRPKAPGTALAGITAIFAGQPDGRGPRLSIELVATRTKDE